MHAKERIQTQQGDAFHDRVKKLLNEISSAPNYLRRLAIDENGRVYFVNVDEIDWIEAAEKYVRLYTGRQTHLLRESMKVLEASLDPEKFLRIHRSTIINTERISEITPWFNGGWPSLSGTANA